jgi:hypothetical protein
MASSGGQRWILADAYGRTWRVSVPRVGASGGSANRANGLAFLLEEMVEDAFAPWGSARGETIADLLEICAELTAKALDHGRA